MCLMDTLLLSTSLCTVPASTRCCIDFVMPFYNYVSPLFTHPHPPPPLSCLSYLPPLFYFSNSVPLIHFYGSLCPCLLSRPILSFFLFDLNFLISSLIYVTPLGFILHPRAPSSSSDGLHCFSFCSLSYFFCFSSSEVFKPSVFCFVCSLSGVHSVFAVA